MPWIEPKLTFEAKAWEPYHKELELAEKETQERLKALIKEAAELNRRYEEEKKRWPCTIL